MKNVTGRIPVWDQLHWEPERTAKKEAPSKLVGPFWLNRTKHNLHKIALDMAGKQGIQGIFEALFHPKESLSCHFSIPLSMWTL